MITPFPTVLLRIYLKSIILILLVASANSPVKCNNCTNMYVFIFNKRIEIIQYNNDKSKVELHAKE